MEQGIFLGNGVMTGNQRLVLKRKERLYVKKCKFIGDFKVKKS